MSDGEIIVRVFKKYIFAINLFNLSTKKLKQNKPKDTNEQ